MSETVSSIITTTSRDVVQLGMTSKIHISAAKMNIAIIRCWTTVSSAIPKKLTGTAQRNIVMARITARITVFLTEELCVDIGLSEVVCYFHFSGTQI